METLNYCPVVEIQENETANIEKIEDDLPSANELLAKDALSVESELSRMLIDCLYN